jgi:hypothetical protein
MAKIPLLWNSGGVKEATELLESLWRSNDEKVLSALAEALIAGPPTELFQNLDTPDQESARERRIFDRLKALEALNTPPLTHSLRAELVRLQEKHPLWRAREGESGRFAIWTGIHSEPEPKYSFEDLKDLSDAELGQALIDEQNDRDGLLNKWRQLAKAEPERVIVTLQAPNLAQRYPSDVFLHALQGLRDAEDKPELFRLLLTALKNLPDAILDEPQISSAAADVIDRTSKIASVGEDHDFWSFYDHLLSAVELDPANSEAPEDEDWLFFALNCSMGRLAEAGLTALFARHLKVGDGIPTDLRTTFDALMSRDKPSHRPARILAASRLSYLFAVDSEWAQSKVLPSLDWARDETEALAVWQGFAWQPRIDPKLWDAIRCYFLAVFEPDHIRRFRDLGDTLAQLFVLVGVEFGFDDLPRDGIRNAIRSMPDELRSRAIAWLAAYVSRSDDQEVDEAQTQLHDVDAVWREKVAPWINHYWPHDQGIRTFRTGEQFALLAIATNICFPDATNRLLPFIVQGHNDGPYYVLNELKESEHPDKHPADTLRLLDAIADAARPTYANDELRNILDRVLRSEPDARENAIYRRWDESLRAQEG